MMISGCACLPSGRPIIPSKGDTISASPNSGVLISIVPRLNSLTIGLVFCAGMDVGVDVGVYTGVYVGVHAEMHSVKNRTMKDHDL